MLLVATAPAAAQEPGPEVRVQIDWQGHPAMHIPWWMYGKGLTDRPLRRRTWRHRFRQTVSEPAMAASGVRLFLAAAMAAERARNPQQARRLILEQLAYVEDFVARHPDRYVLARTPEQAREALATTDKMVIVHSIEGMHELLWEPTDARFWADQGVALVTLIHLRDEELGGAAMVDMAIAPLINRKGARKRRRGEPRGLTPMGREAIVQLDEAGILVDFTHMSPDALEDALEVCAAHDIPPLLTHSTLASVRPGERSIREDQLVEVYRLGGFFAAGLNAMDLGDDDTVGLPEDVCAGSVEAWAWHHGIVQETLRAHVADIFEDPSLTPEALTETQKTRLATGWSSDWNGWTSHSRPVHRRCRDVAEPTELDRKGLAHPGLLPQHWHAVEARGVSLDPMLRASERFLQLWEDARAREGE